MRNSLKAFFGLAVFALFGLISTHRAEAQFGWTTVAPMLTPRQAHAAALGGDGRIYVFGGWNSGGYVNTVEAYDPGSNRWTTVGTRPPRDLAAAVSGQDGRIYLIGGRDTTGTPLQRVEVYDPRSNT